MKKTFILLSILSLCIPMPASGETPACRATEHSRALDFWLGEWRVTDLDETTEYGSNRIESALQGCAIFEHWRSADAGQGKSLFYFDVTSDRWSQVWVTEDTSRPGGLKLKYQQPGAVEHGIRFQGAVATPQGDILDRTTLVPQTDGNVRQTIEISNDNGANWQTIFDALYLPLNKGQN